MAKREIAELPVSLDGEDAARFARLRGKALAKVEHILDLPKDLENFAGDQLMQHRRLRIQLDAAQSVIADAIKVNENALHAQERQDWLDMLRERMEQAQAKLPKP